MTRRAKLKVPDDVVIVTVADSVEEVPDAPAQLTLNVVVIVSAPVGWLPDTPLAPVQLAFAGDALAEQPVAPVDDQVKVEGCPEETDVGLAEIVAVGNGLTVTVTEAGAEVPPAPVQVSVYVRLAVRAVVFWVPDVNWVPVQFGVVGFAVAVHAVASVDDHVSIDI